MRPRADRACRGFVSILLALLSLTSTLPGQEHQSLYPPLDAQFKPLREQFNSDAGKVRLLILLDPT